MKAAWVVGSARASAASGLLSGTVCRPNTSSARLSTWMENMPSLATLPLPSATYLHGQGAGNQARAGGWVGPEGGAQRRQAGGPTTWRREHPSCC